MDHSEEREGRDRRAAIDAHTRPDGSRCDSLMIGASLDARWVLPTCDCGASLTVNGGRAPVEVLPVRLCEDLAPLEQVPLPEVRVCPSANGLAATAVVLDCWGHTAVLVTWGHRYQAGKELRVGPSHRAARRLAELLTRGMSSGQADDVTAWLLSQWRDFATAQARREESADLRQENLHHPASPVSGLTLPPRS